MPSARRSRTRPPVIHQFGDASLANETAVRHAIELVTAQAARAVAPRGPLRQRPLDDIARAHEQVTALLDGVALLLLPSPPARKTA